MSKRLQGLHATTHVWDGTTLYLVGLADNMAHCAKLWSPQSPEDTYGACPWGREQPQAWALSGANPDFDFVRDRLSRDASTIYDFYATMEYMRRLGDSESEALLKAPLRLTVVTSEHVHTLEVTHRVNRRFKMPRDRKVALGPMADLIENCMQYLLDIDTKALAVMGMQGFSYNDRITVAQVDPGVWPKREAYFSDMRGDQVNYLFARAMQRQYRPSPEDEPNSPVTVKVVG